MNLSFLHLVDNAVPSPQHVVDSARHFGYLAITLIEAVTDGQRLSDS
jgi:hypothetical protein